MENNFKQVAEIIQQVNNTSSKKEKQEIIVQHRDNTLFQSVLNHLFNPYLKTNIAKKKLSKSIAVERDTTLPMSVEAYMTYLQQSSGRDSQIATVQHFIDGSPEEVKWLLEAMATKTIKIGATSSTINKAFEYQFIPVFDCMLAEKYIETKKVKVKGVSQRKLFEHWKRYIGKRVIATKKIDGNRCVIFVNDDGTVKLYTREGHVMEGFVEIEEAFSKFPKGQVYDGEILATNEEGLNSQDLFKKTSKIVKKKGIKKGLEFFAFDTLPIAHFKSGGFNVPCENRKDILSKIIKKMDDPIVHYVEPLYIGEFDKEIIDNLAEQAKARQEEGIMVQIADAPYQCKRTFDILKVKSMESCDIRCVDVYEGKSDSTAGKLGGVVCDYKGYRINVGGGFDAEQRINLWEDPSLVIGKIIEVQYFEEFEDDETGDLDLRFATFKTIRDDKDEPSYH